MQTGSRASVLDVSMSPATRSVERTVPAAGVADEPLEIGLIAPPWAAVPPRRYGGTEAVVDRVARGLAARGHHVRLFATADSQCRVPQDWLFDAPPTPVNEQRWELQHVAAAYESLATCDVIHDHTLLGPSWAAAIGRPRVVTTCHGPFDPATERIYATLGAQVAVVAISHRQRQTAPTVPFRAVIHHGVEPTRFRVGTGSSGALLFVGRMAPEKGVREAILIARAAGRPLRVIAKMSSAREVRYYHDTVEPILGRDVTLLGETTPQERNREMARALALVNPIRWEEPFGLVMVEAMACGTPVITCPRGAAPEIVQDGVTGFLVTSLRSAAAAVAAVGELSRAACRSWVERRFSADRMVEEYLLLYRSLLSEGPVAVSSPLNTGAHAPVSSSATYPSATPA